MGDAVVNVSGGQPLYSWSLASGSLPAGVQFDPVFGVLMGTPTAAGTSKVTIDITDAAGATTTAVPRLAVRA